MKAEERKELEHNALLTRLHNWKEKLKGRAGYIAGGSIITLVLIILFVRYLVNSNRAVNSSLWINFMTADTVKQLDEMYNSKDYKGKPIWAFVKMQKARLAMYRDGLDKIGTTDSAERTKAYNQIEEGRKMFLELTTELNDTALKQEAWLNAARAEETLLGVPKAEKNDEYRGSFDKVIEYLRKAAEINPDSEVSKSYVALADKKKSEQTSIEKFYKDLNRLSYVPEFDFGNPGSGVPKFDFGDPKTPAPKFDFGNPKTPAPKVDLGIPGFPTPKLDLDTPGSPAPKSDLSNPGTPKKADGGPKLNPPK